MRVKYFIPIFGLLYPYWAKDDLLNDMGDDYFKLVWVFYHLLTTIPLLVLVGFSFILFHSTK